MASRTSHCRLLLRFALAIHLSYTQQRPKITNGLGARQCQANFFLKHTYVRSNLPVNQIATEPHKYKLAQRLASSY